MVNALGYTYSIMKPYGEYPSAGKILTPIENYFNKLDPSQEWVGIADKMVTAAQLMNPPKVILGVIPLAVAAATPLALKMIPIIAAAGAAVYVMGNEIARRNHGRISEWVASVKERIKGRGTNPKDPAGKPMGPTVATTALKAGTWVAAILATALGLKHLAPGRKWFASLGFALLAGAAVWYIATRKNK